MSGVRLNKEKIIRDQYDQMADTYDARWQRYVRTSLQTMERKLHFEGHERILDVGCGTGALETLLVRRYPGLNITGVDLSSEMIAVAKRKHKIYPHLTFQEANVSKLPFEDQSFDCIVSASAFHYFGDPLAALREMKRVLKPGGRVVILDWCKDYLVCRICDLALKIWDPAYHGCYRLNELRRFFADAGFQIESASRFRFMLVWGMMLIEARKSAELL